MGLTESLKSKAKLEIGSLGRLKKNENSNFQHYHMLDPKKYLLKKNHRFFFQKG
jgi:hypothetical protein